MPPIIDLCHSLQILDVAENDIKIIPDSYFASSSKMTYFGIRSNKLTMTDNSTFVGLVSIRILHIGDNMIGDIIGDLIWNHPTLQILYLDRNKLTQLPSLVTDGIPELTHLNVANNKIRNISVNQVGHLEKLNTLDVRNNILKEVAFIYALPNLQRIYIGDNLFLLTDYLFDDMKHLVFLDLRESGLVSFPLLSASKHSLTNIQLSNNQIRCVDVLHLANMTNLKFLYIADHDIERFPDYGCRGVNGSDNIFPDLQFLSLRWFDIKCNQLTNLTKGILSKMPALEKLVASYNGITDMPFLHVVGVSLKYVYLDHNRISHIEGWHVSGLSSLEQLILSHNNIAHFNSNVLVSLTNLRSLDLRYNQLTTPPMTKEFYLTSSMDMFLGDNPYICDSRIMADLLIDGLLCSTPLKFAGRSIVYAREAIIRGNYRILMC